MKTATLLKTGLLRGNANLYRLDPPLGDVDHVIVSAVDGWAYETYIFPANAAGEVVSWGELDGSERGHNDHERALANIGYRVEVGL